MTEQERPSEDARLKEILGFDPESGERIEDRSQLKDYKTSRLAVPAEVQEAFVEHITQKNRPQRQAVKVVPEKLLLVSQRPNYKAEPITRTYHFWDPSQNPSEQKFPVRAQAGFGQIKSVAIINERNSDLVDDLVFTDYIHLAFLIGATQFNFGLSQRSFEVVFNDKNCIHDIWFVSENSTLVFSSIGEREIKEVTEKGQFKLDRGNDYYLFLAQQQNIRLKSFKKDILEDEFLIPQQINREEIIQRLFDPSTLKDPVNALPELDDSWRFANLLDVVGVKWERW